MARLRKKPRKPRRRVSHAQRMLNAAWNFAYNYSAQPYRWASFEDRMAWTIRRILREVARG